MKVAPVRIASASERALLRSAGQPTRATACRARSGSRSAMPATCRPGVRGPCDRNIEPNLPGADDADADRVAGLGPGGELLRQAHAGVPAGTVRG